MKEWSISFKVNEQFIREYFNQDEPDGSEAYEKITEDIAAEWLADNFDYAGAGFANYDALRAALTITGPKFLDRKDEATGTSG